MDRTDLPTVEEREAIWALHGGETRLREFSTVWKAKIDAAEALAERLDREVDGPCGNFIRLDRDQAELVATALSVYADVLRDEAGAEAERRDG